MNWLFVSLGALALLCLWLVHIYFDVQQRKKRFEEQKIPVIWQYFSYMNLFVNLLPKNPFFPYRYRMECEYAALFKKFDSPIIVFVSYKYQEVLVSDPKFVKDITVTHRKKFDKPRDMYQILRLFGENVLSAPEAGGEWKKHRSIIGPAFSEGNNALVAESVVKYINMIMAEWAQKEGIEGELQVDMDAEMVRSALAVLGAAGMGVDLSTTIDVHPDSKGVMHKLCLRDTLQGVSKHLVVRLLMPEFLFSIPFGIFKQTKIAYDEFRRYMNDFCEERKKRHDEETVIDRKRVDLLTSLVINNTNKLTPDEIFGDIFVLLLAGHETTAHTLSWCIRLLAANPDKQEKLYQEVVSVLGDRNPTYKDFESLVYARSIFKEALRLYPQTPGAAKYNESGIQLGGYEFPPQTRFTLAINALLSSDKFWDAPEEFRPERFDHRETDNKPIDPYVYIPFSSGKRQCMGFKFAQVEGTLALALLFRKYKFEIPKNISREYFLERKSVITIVPKNDVKILLKRR